MFQSIFRRERERGMEEAKKVKAYFVAEHILKSNCYLTLLRKLVERKKKAYILNTIKEKKKKKPS